MDPQRFGLRRDEVETVRMSVPAYLIEHARGTLVWDAGCVPDRAWVPNDGPVEHHIQLPDGSQRRVTMTRRIDGQLADVGHSPAGITFLALSHYHYDHTGNANAFVASTWLARPAERTAMFGSPAPRLTQPADYARLRTARTELVEVDEFDVFGDSSVRMIATPGHTPGHQLLVVRLARTGTVVLSGDLYHYSEERLLDRVPTFEHNPNETRRSRTAIEELLRVESARLWIQHDWLSSRAIRTSPDFYD